jgi:hypothetical protein
MDSDWNVLRALQDKVLKGYLLVRCREWCDRESCDKEGLISVSILKSGYMT